MVPEPTWVALGGGPVGVALGVPEPTRVAVGGGEGEWVRGGTTVQPCLWRRRNAFLRKMAAISEAEREEKEEELEEAIAAKRMVESRRRKKVEEGKKVCGAFFRGRNAQTPKSKVQSCSGPVVGTRTGA